MAQRTKSGTLGRAGSSWRRRVAAAAMVALVAATAALAGATSAVAKPAAPVLAFTPSPFDYGRVTPGESASQRFRLTNSGRKATGKLKVTLAGAAAFTITRDRCSGTRLRPGKSCVVRVRFAPTSLGTVTASLTAASKQHRVSASAALSGTGAGLGAAPSFIYWANSGDGTIRQANLDGSDVQAIVSGQDQPQAVAVDVSYLYWANSLDGTIWRADLDGANAQAIVTDQEADGLAADGGHLYWTDQGDGQIWRANPDGSNPQAIVSNQNSPWGVAVDASHIYWTNNEGDGTIWRANLDGSDPQEIVTGQSIPFGVAVDPDHLYWAALNEGTINRANLDGTNPQTLVTTTAGNFPSGVTVDASHLYWATSGLPGGEPGRIWRANLDGSSPQAIVTGQSDPRFMAITPPPTAVLGFTPSSSDFGQVPVGQSTPQLFTLANSGVQATGPLTLTLTGAGAAAFTLNPGNCTPGTSLAPGADCQVEVIFAPTSQGTVTATLTAASPTAYATVALTGTGVGNP
jgi:sugar lactone lactonase YvrE